jgi:actin-related protein 5
VRTLEAALLEHDPEFDEDMTLAAQNQRQNALINAFVRSDQKFDLDDAAQAHQIHLNVERIRVPETWFHPAMAGVDSAGIAEVAGWLLNGFSLEERRRMMQVRRTRRARQMIDL